MNTLTKRHLLRTGAALAAGAAFTRAGLAEDKPAKKDVDLKALYEAPALGDMSIGPDTAKVTIVEYASATCPHCATFHSTVFPQLKKDYIDTGKVRFIFREFPLNDLALAGFMVARCAPKEKYFAIIGAEFGTLEKWAKDPLPGLKGIAQQAGMTSEQFEACLKNEQIARGILAIHEKGQSFGVDGTPFFFINGKPLEGEKSLDEFRKVIDPLLG